MTDPAARRIAEERRKVIAAPGQPQGYLLLARALSDVKDFSTGTRALIAAFLISRPAIEAVRLVLEQVMFHPQPRAMALLWRMAEEAATYPHEELLEREIAERRTIGEAERRNYLNYLFRQRLPRRDTLPYVICGMPKSASTFVSALAAEMTGLPLDDPHNYNDYFTCGFDKGLIWDLCQRDVVVHGHLAANPRALCYFRLLKVRPIVTVRNIFDALRSYADHMFPKARGDDTVLPTLLDFAILRMAGFYVDFYASWYRARDRFDMLWVDYDEVKSDPAGLVRRIAGHLGSGVVAGGIDKAMALAAPGGLDEKRRDALMFNKGVAGRGSALSDRQRALVRSMYDFYPGVDFSRIDPEFEPIA